MIRREFVRLGFWSTLFGHWFGTSPPGRCATCAAYCDEDHTCSGGVFLYVQKDDPAEVGKGTPPADGVLVESTEFMAARTGPQFGCPKWEARRSPPGSAHRLSRQFRSCPLPR